MARESIVTMKLTYDSVHKDTNGNVRDTSQDEPGAPIENFIRTHERKPKPANKLELFSAHLDLRNMVVRRISGRS